MIGADDIHDVTLNAEIVMTKRVSNHWLVTRLDGTRISTTSRMVMGIATFLLLTACAGQQTRLTAENRRALSTEPQIHAVHYVWTPVFMVESTGYAVASAFFTPLVVLAAAGEGMGLQRDLRLEDPVFRVKDRLVSKLQTDFNLTNVRVVSDPPKNDGVATLKQVLQTGIVLDVKTAKWGLDNARVKYSARARLLRLADSAILWQATCEFVADKAQPSPKMDELKANDGVLLKTKILEAADGCADQLFAWVTAGAR